MADLGESITVVNKSGKIVSTSKHLVNVFKEARSAYLEKKAELKAERADDLQRKATKKAIESGRRSPGSDRHSTSSSRRHDSRRAYSRDSSPSRHSTSSRHRDSRTRDSKHHDSRHRDSRHRESRHRDSRQQESSRSERKPSAPRGHSDNYFDEGPSPRRTRTQPIAPSQLRHSHGPEDEGGSSSENLQLQQQLTRRHSDSETLSPRHAAVSDEEEIDMALAYGEPPPPPLPVRTNALRVEDELAMKMTALTRMLEEANCLQSSARAVIKHLEENPDAMAAVALTLAEISNLAARMAPGALTSLKGSFPVVIGLLASPEFLIAGGVAIGVTVVMFGGYKIIKRIKANKLLEKQGEAEELEEITSDLDKIESWRRGIQLDDADNMSVATSVEGEFITPKASMQLREEGVMAEKKDTGSNSKKGKGEKAAEKEEKKRGKKEKSEREKQEKKDKKEREKDKEPSGLMMLFKRDKEQVVG